MLLLVLIESLDNEQYNDLVTSVDVNRVGSARRTSVTLADAEDSGEGADEHIYGYADDPYARTPASTDDLMDKQGVKAMLLAE